ncbi:MAG TPA: proline racemase family protein [Pirellulaceae bacterium]|nr:proline racemase family protein [Pirellulaceae bacterium]HMO93667.1 proline racemase family protein [Pirellulaceae bacterium]HMP68409.1 proline racemase family protein [Pirellulaceae bacterium]
MNWSNELTSLHAIDSHTAGEPTRVVVSGVPEPNGKTLLEKRAFMQAELDWVRTATVCEPRGHDAVVGALLCQPERATSLIGVIFFNNVGYLNGCIHGTIGVAQTLQHLGRIGAGEYDFDTPAGVVTVSLEADGSVRVTNVRSFRHLNDMQVTIQGRATLQGDVAWGGNWFFLTDAPADLPICFDNLEKLTAYAWEIRQALRIQGITGLQEAEIDHIELFGPSDHPQQADCKNFVLCPGKAYDRSPCGTGTSAKLACLYDAGFLKPGAIWRQAGILDTVFCGSVEPHPAGGVIPTIIGRAYVTAETTLLIDPLDIFRFGIVS